MHTLTHTTDIPSLAALRLRRLDALEALRTAQDLQAIVIHSQGNALGAATRSNAYLRLFVDWDGVDAVSTLVMTPTHRLIIVCDPFQAQAARAVDGVDKVLFVRPGTVGQVVRDTLGLDPAAAANLGIAGLGEMQFQIYQSFQQAMPKLHFCDLSADLDQWRGSKNEAELIALEGAAGLCDELFERFPAFLKEQKPAWQTQRDLEHFALIRGAEYCKTWLTVSPEAQSPQYMTRENHRSPEAGDQVLLGLALRLDGYWGHAIRMGSFRQAKPEHRRLHDVVLKMFNVALPFFASSMDLIKAEEAIRVILEDELGDIPDASISRFRSGHGLGLSYEEPSSVAAFPQYVDPYDTGVPVTQKARAGAVFELHPNLFVKGVGGAALGDMIEVSEGPGRRLVQTPLDFRIWS